MDEPDRDGARQVRTARPPPALEVVGIGKRFGPVAANDGVSISVPKGTIHGIVGENGAGKSTLMSIVYGYHRPDRGEIRINGTAAAIGSPDKAIALGIGMVHQHFMLVDTFTVLENVILGAENGLLLRRSLAAARRELAGLARDHGLEVDPDAITGDLPVGLRQRVEILKALYRGAGILILDEPTAVLTPQEADDLFRIVRMLRDRGRTIILITHKLREIMEVTDRVTVMRAGRVVGEVDTAATDREALAGMMVGRDVPVPLVRRGTEPGPAVLEVEGLEVRDREGTVRVRDVGFTVRAGEVVGVAGVAGNGQSELLEAVAGMRPAHRGTIRVNGRAAHRRGREDAARTMRGLGLAHVPEDRQRMGLVPEFDASENCILGYHRDRRYNRGPWLMRRAVWGRRRGSSPDSMCVRPCRVLRRPGSPAATSRRSSSAARSPAIRMCSLPASRHGGSTSVRRRSSTARSRRCAMRARRFSSCRWNSMRSCPSRTASSSCSAAGSSARRRPVRTSGPSG